MPWVVLMVLLLSIAVLYACTLPRWPVIGLSAAQLSIHLNLEPLPGSGSPMWGWLIQHISALSLGSLGFRCNLASLVPALCVLALFFVFQLVYLRALLRRGSIHECVSASALATWLLATSIPFWLMATRAHPLAFDLLLLFVTVGWLLLYRRSGRRRYLYCFSGCLGMGVMEYGSFIVLGPVLAASAWLTLWQRRDLSRNRVLGCLGIATASALLTLLWAVARYAGSPQIEWLGIGSGGAVVRLVLAARWHMVMGGVAQAGWLTILLFAVLPWIMCMVTARRRRRKKRDEPVWHRWFMYGAVAFVGLAVLMNTAVAPWHANGEIHLVVIPYVLVASYLGTIVAVTLRALRNRRAAWLPALGAVGIAVALPVVNLRDVQPDRTRGLYVSACDTVAFLENQSVVIAGSALDSLLRLAAFEQHRTLSIVRPGRDKNSIRYRRSLFHSDRLQSLAEVGFVPWLRDILLNHPNERKRLAFMSQVELIPLSGRIPVPLGIVYRAEEDIQHVDLDRVWAQHRQMWSHVPPKSLQADAGDGPVSRRMHWLRILYSKGANDLALLISTRGQQQRADEAYRVSLAYDPDNVSAMLNSLNALDPGEDKDAVSNLLARVEEQLTGRRLPLTALVQRYGYLRSGEPMEQLRQMGGLPAVGDGRPEHPDMVTAGDLFERGDVIGAYEKVGDVLAEDPSRERAWLLRGMLANKLGHEREWIACWEHMEVAGYEWAPFLAIEAERKLAGGDRAVGKRLYVRALRELPFNLQLLRAVGVLELEDGNRDHVSDIVRAILAQDPNDAWANFALSTSQYESGDLQSAETSLRAVMERNPVPLQRSNLAWVLAMQGKLDEALRHARLATRQDPSLIAGQDTLGVILLRLGELTEAEEVLSKALKSRPNDADLRIHYAQLMLLYGRTKEARDSVLPWLERSDLLSDEQATELQGIRTALARTPLHETPRSAPQ